jgi:hypothetical protein
MKRIAIFTGILILFIAFTSLQADAQFRGQEPGTPRVAGSMVQSREAPSLFSFFNPENFNMSHSYSMSYMMMGGRGMAVGMYTNSMFYRISDPLDVRLDVSMAHSPYNSFNNTMNDFSGVFISRAEVNYQPSENFRIQFQYRQIPYSGYGYGYGSPFYNPWYYRYGY